MTRRLIALTSLLVALLVSLATPAFAHDDKPAARAVKGDPVVVSFTFDGGYKGQDAAAKILAAHNMAGTFYINSGYIGYPAYMTLDEIRGIARQRHEIGGASTLNNDLTKLPFGEAKQQVCDDRATLDRLGFQVTSFAYPSGADNASVRAIVSRCGYNSARDVSGLYNSEFDCSSCPVGETIPPTSDFRVRTGENSTRLSFLKARVTAAEKGGGGWVPLVFQYICVCPDKGDTAITPQDFTEFVDWVAKRPVTTSVATVDQVVGGQFKPVVGTPLPRLVPTASTAASRVPMSQRPAFTVAGLSIKQSTVVAVMLLISITVVITYRVSSRGNRYAG